MVACSPKQGENAEGQAKSLPVLTISEDSVALLTEFPARIEGKVNVDIRPQTEGYIEKILVEEGAFVKAGQPLFKIDDRLYVEQLNTSKANLASAEASLNVAQLEVERQTVLKDNKVNSDFQLRSAKAQYQTAKANVAQQQASVETARINLGFTTVKAPVSGFIGRIPKRIGNLVSRSDAQPLTTLSEINEVYAYFSMSEKDFLAFNQQYSGADLNQKIKNVASVSLILADGNTYEQQGRIQMINGEFDAGTGAISMRAVFKNPNNMLRTGNTGKIIIPRIASKALMVPVLATVDVQDRIFVVRVNADGKAERVPITISTKQGDFYIVASGLKAGDRIITQELGSVNDGDLIQAK